MENFLSRLARNPYAPIDGASVTRVDELGNGYDDWNNLIAPKFEQPQQTWGETALGVATAPARMATALAGSISPYGQDGWQVPPIIDEGVNALSAVGDAYNYGMDQDEINNRALGMAGFMMGGGGLAARPATSTGISLGDRVMAKYLDWKNPDESSFMDWPPLHPNEYKSLLTKPEGVFRNPVNADDALYADLNRRSMETYGVGYEGLTRDQTRHIRDGIEPPKPRPTFDVIDGGLYSNASKEGGLLSNILGYFQGNKEPVTVRGYHGTRSEFDKFNGPSVFASENPDAASEWAMVANRDGGGPNVLPLDITASNPYYAKSLFPDQAELDRIAAADPDVVFYPPSTQHGTTFDKYPGQVFEARKPGTVRSATTGETLFSNASKEGAIPAILAGQEAKPIRAYRGVLNSDGIDAPMAEGRPFWMTTDRGLANDYADGEAVGYNASPAVAAVDANFSNPYVFDAKGSTGAEIPYNNWFTDTTKLAAKALADGHDGLIINNLRDEAWNYNSPATVMAALKPNTVRSATTGETLFSNADSRPALLGAGQERPAFSLDKIDGEYAAMSPGGDMMGNFRFEETPQAAFVLDAMVKPEYRRQGIASQVYGAIQDDLGKPLTPDVELTPDGYAFWKKHYPDAVQKHEFMDGRWIDPMGYVPDEVPDWRLAGGPNRPPNALWSNSASSPSILAGQEQDIPDWLLPYFR